MSLADLPDKLIAHLCTYLEYPDVCNLMETSKKNYNAIMEHEQDKIKPNCLRNAVIDFNDPNTPHDRVLVVEGRKFYVKSELLSFSSEFFEAMFKADSGFIEATENEIELKDVKPEEFKDFLKAIHPTIFHITVDNYRSLLSLATRFLAGILVQRCHLFLMSYFDKLDALDLLEIAFEYNMEDLKDKVAVFLRKDTSVDCAGCKNLFCQTCKKSRFTYHQHTFIRSDIPTYATQNIDRIKRLSADIQLFIFYVLLEPGKTPI